MVICIIAMIVFGILGIFSVGYRQLAREAFDCVFRMATLRPCQSDFDQRMRSKITAKLMRFPKLARFTHRHFEALSWIFTVAMFLSMGYTAYSVYNLAVYHTCDPQHPENCVFTPMLGNVTNVSSTSGNICVITGEFAEFYGQGCPHCAKMAPIVLQVENETGVNIQQIEVWYNDTNKATYMRHAATIERDCGILGVPAFYSNKTDKAVCGEMTAQQLEDFIRANG